MNSWLDHRLNFIKQIHISERPQEHSSLPDSHHSNLFRKDKKIKKQFKNYSKDHLFDNSNSIRSPSDTDFQGDSLKDQESQNNNILLKKNNKGLKVLSIIVRDIVSERPWSTYKDVAEMILTETLKLEKIDLNSSQNLAKEEQNIKRRVYDALNVLISAGVLVKEDKRVARNEMGGVLINNKRIEMNSLKSQLVFS